MYYDCKTIGGLGVLVMCEEGSEFDKELGLCVWTRINHI